MAAGRDRGLGGGGGNRQNFGGKGNPRNLFGGAIPPPPGPPDTPALARIVPSSNKRPRINEDISQGFARPVPPPTGRTRQAFPSGDRVLPATGSILAGYIVSYDSVKTYGFINCASIPDLDTYFNRSQLPPEYQESTREFLQGAEVEFELAFTNDGKARAEAITILTLQDPLLHNQLGEFLPTSDGKGEGKFFTLGEKARDRDRERERDKRILPPPLDSKVIEAMTKLLEERGGVMDHGKFTNFFPKVKKSQLSVAFDLVPEEGRSGGRWQIMLRGVQPLTPDERAAKEAQAAFEQKDVLQRIDQDKQWDDRDDDASLDTPTGKFSPEPSTCIRVIGFIKRWDPNNECGYISADGVDDVFLDKLDMPPEMQSYSGSLEGCELTFALEMEDEKLKAKDAHFLLTGDGEGGWQLRRTL